MPGKPRAPRFLALIGVLVLGVSGLLLLTDRPGLTAEYFALTPHWDTTPVYSQVTSPQLENVEAVSRILVSQQIFSIRWHGWIHVAQSGIHQLSVAADEAAFLRMDGEVLLDAQPSVRRKQETVERHLEEGFHAIEVGLSQTGRRSRLRLSWSPPDGNSDTLPDGLLYARRPVTAYRWLRGLTAPLTVLSRQILGAVLVLGALLLWRPDPEKASPASRRSERQDRRFGDSRGGRRARRAAFLLALFVATWLATVPFTTDTLDGDDVRYLDAAYHGKKMAWIVNRYVHIYLLRAFFWMENGDAFRGSRALWSFLFATTVTSLAAAAMSLGPGLQLRTLAIALFLLLGQFGLMGSIGAAYPDYTVMMFITLAMAVYLHGVSQRSSGFWDWHVMALGALTVLAFRSKETGFIIAWLALSFLWHEGRINARRFGGRMMIWVLGAALAYGLVMSLDALLVGDFWFGVRPSSYGSLQGMMSAAGARTYQPFSLWMNVLTHGHPAGAGVGFALRNLWVLVAMAAIAAFVGRKRIELRILHLMPAVYLVMMFVLRPPIFTPRHVWPILPVACMCGALLAFYCGVEDLRWRQLVAPRFLIPVVLAGTAVALILAPMKADSLGAEILDPLWQPDLLHGSTAQLWAWMATASGGMLLITTVIAVFRQWPSRMVWLTVCLLVFFGPGVHVTRLSLATHTAAQRGQLTLYPWRAFETQIRNERPRTIQVAPRLTAQFQMVGRNKTRERLARVFFGRRRLRLTVREDLMPGARVAVGSRRDLNRWQQQAPEIIGTEEIDPSGQVILVRPRGLDSR